MIRLFATALGLVALAVGAAGLVARYLPVTNEVVLVVAAAAPYLTVASLIALFMFVVSRRWVLTIVAALLCVVMIAVQLPRFIGPEKVGVPSVAVRVVTANLGRGHADPRAVTELAGTTADVLVIQELTPEAATGLSGAGLDAIFPYRALNPAARSSGVGVWSRYPIIDSARIDAYVMPMLRARIQVPGVMFPTTVLSVHLAAPWVQSLHYFRDDVANFPVTLRELSREAGSGAVIVAGDFNSTLDMQPFRKLLAEGYRDAGEQAGAGLTRTYPSKPWRRPVIGIDHVLVHNCSASSVRTVALPGSDHRGLATVIDVPVDPTASYPVV
ncbi:endonuclease [Mycolicibacterium moriokaense]|jgi:endonuclease/exonuclease/phosphatase family metal-dependent hydrolase|uniref:Endonuclease n=1 Tax=Mycolicibacterium moriokaense TaxID=39691 RepID=A0AAD1MA15_9MYCO|nr:endonuclease/exonuclease/phosphatase family protein [Mycolicibacterium moriokaense]MCV7042281.1 endonuclease/exonuclease/phosphatase family protein [Mycolicibacterium moriokaense]ORB17603.1 endonuclease [Mycolicibacterium moriokaense]BBX05055.1 endonuclease [Mycolicibacterium moriokaense]